MADTTTTPTTVMRYAGKLIALSDDGRIVDFQALVEIDGEHSTLSGLSAEEAAQLRPYLGQRVAVTVSALGGGEDDGLPVAEHAAVLASIPKPDAPVPECTGLHAGEEWRECSACNPPDTTMTSTEAPRPAPPGLSELHDQVAAVMEAWRGQNGGIFAVNGCALEVARLVLTGQAGSLAPNASGEQVAAHYNLEDLERERQAAEVARTEREAELSCLRGTVERQRRELEDVALAAGMLPDGYMPTAEEIEARVRQLVQTSEHREAVATDAMRMLWLVVREAGGTVSVPLRSMLSADWSACALARSNNLATGDVELFAQAHGETAKPRSSLPRAMHQQLLDMLGAQDHQGAAARIGELVGLELLLHAGGAGKGVTAIAQERRGQIEREGYNPDDDLRYRHGELARAADCYVRLEAMRSLAETVPGTSVDDRVPPEWPWDAEWWKPKGRRDNLVRAGALIAAELDRMDREEGRHA